LYMAFAQEAFPYHQLAFWKSVVPGTGDSDLLMSGCSAANDVSVD
jgi:hypothetical protein